MNNLAKILKDEIAVRYSERPDVNRDFLQFDVPNGWDDVKKMTNKVLEYNGRKFTFTCWNSDHNYCCFAAPRGGSQTTAKIK